MTESKTPTKDGKVDQLSTEDKPSPECDVRGNIAVYVAKLKDGMNDAQQTRLDSLLADLESSIQCGASAKITKFTETMIAARQKNLAKFLENAGVSGAEEKTAVLRGYYATLHNYTKPENTVEGFQFRGDIARERAKKEAQKKDDSGAKIG